MPIFLRTPFIMMDFIQSILKRLKILYKHVQSILMTLGLGKVGTFPFLK